MPIPKWAGSAERSSWRAFNVVAQLGVAAVDLPAAVRAFGGGQAALGPLSVVAPVVRPWPVRRRGPTRAALGGPPAGRRSPALAAAGGAGRAATCGAGRAGACRAGRS